MKIFNQVQPLVNLAVSGIKAPWLGLLHVGINESLLRIVIGSLGIALPVVLVIWGLALNGAVAGSMSDYYAFRTRDAFVGILFVIGWVLFAYKGYEEKIDGVAGKLACVFAIGIALFSNTDGGWMSKVHFTCASCLFALLAFFSIFLFTKTDNAPREFWEGIKWVFQGGATKKEGAVTERKITRNRIYITCGIVILLMLALSGLYMWLWQNTVLSDIKLVLILEWIMVWAFAVSWLTKGNFIFADKKEKLKA